MVPFLIMLMWSGMLWSRALLSVGMMGFFAYTVFFYWKQGFLWIKRSLWLKLLIGLFLIPVLTVFWSEDFPQWGRSVQVKLPLLFMPFAIPVFSSVKKAERIFLLALLCGFVVVSSFYSYWSYFSVPGITESYLRAKVLPVAMSNDHVRYGWLLIIAYAWLLYELLSGEIGRKMKSAAWFVLLYLAIFMHVLAAKTALLGFYVVTSIAIFSIVPPKSRLASLGVFLVLPVLAWFMLPSFQNRLRFVFWDFQNYTRGNYVEGLSDGPRVLSYMAGMDIMMQDPVKGAGSGDVLSETGKWYNAHAPYLKDYERLLPSNEVLMYGCAGGIFAALFCFTALMYPLFMRKLRGNMLWLSFHLVSFAGFMYEIGLEVQHGVFLYLFFSCWFYSFLGRDAEVGAV